MDIDRSTFYDEGKIAIVPMGFCYPGKSKNEDLPPRKEWTTIWHSQILNCLDQIELILLIGTYAQDYYLKDKLGMNLIETVKNSREYLPNIFVLLHPPFRNNI